MTGSHASAVGLDKSRLLIVQAAPFVGVVITPYREWFAADVGLGTDRRPLELAVYRAMLGHTVHTAKSVYRAHPVSRQMRWRTNLHKQYL
jgi:hypothetical protein